MLKRLMNIRKRNVSLLIIGLVVIALIKFLPFVIAEASGSWTIGGDGYVGLPTDPSRSQGTGASAFGIGDAFIVQPYKLPTFSLKDGRKNMIEDADAYVPRYTTGVVAFVPYDTTEYLNNHSFDSVMVVKRPDVTSTRIYYSKKAGYLNSVIKLSKDIQTETSYFKDGVFYSRLKDKTDKWILDNWKDIINNETNHNTYLSRSEGVWSYITRGTTITGYSMKEYHIADRIDDYLHIESLGINPNDMASAKPEVVRELKLRYIDLMMSVYIQIPDSFAEDYWETAINTYIKGIEGTEENKCNLSITAGFMARGYFTDDKGKEHLENIIAGVQDFLDMTIATSENYSLGTQDSANTVENSLEKAGLKNNYYNRLLESIRLSLIYQKKNNLTVNRTYNTEGLWGSNIVSRLTLKKPLIDGTSVTYKTPWSDIARIQNIFLKDYYYGSIIVPAYTGLPSPTFKATIKVASTRKDSLDKTTIEIKDDTTLNDSPKLTINLSYGSDEAKWKEIFLACDYYKVQVSFKRKPTTPSAEYYKDAYVSEPKTIKKDVLESILLKDDKTKLYEWLDKSLKAVPIDGGEKKTYEYEATITIYYAKSSTSLDKMNKVTASTKVAKIKYYKKDDIIITPTPGTVTPTPGAPEEVETAIYVSEPDAYSELKEGSIYNETFEAMAGVPTTRNLYFGSGGSEFMVEVEVMYDKDKSATRKYESHFAGTECEYKTNDQLKGGTGAYTKTETFVADSIGKTISKSVTDETSKIVTPNGNSSGNITVSGHTSSTTLWAEWTGSISNSTSEPANIGAFTPGQAGSPCAGNAFNPGTQRTKAEPTTNWSVNSFNTALNQAITWATSMEATNSSFTVQKIADSDGQARIYKVGNAVITVTMTGGSNSYANTVQPSFSKNGTYTSASASSASVTNSERAVLGSGWGWTAGKLGYGSGYVAGCGHGCTKVWDVEPKDAVPASGTPGQPGYNPGSPAVIGVPHVHTHVCGTFTPGVDITQGASSSIGYTIKVTFQNGSLSATNYDGNSSEVTTSTINGLTGIPAHALCGPCCSHDLPDLDDTWTQEVTFDTLKIVDVRVWKIESSYVNGMEEITYTEDDTIKATIKQGDPNIFYNIAASDTSQDGRLRYSLQQQQHDSVIWYERNSAGEEKRTNKCNGLSSPLSSSNPVQSTGQGHLKSWATGILYNNTLYANDFDHHKEAYAGKKSGITDFATDTIDKQTEEYERFNTRRNQENTVTVISDMLILQTSSGDQSVVYFDTDQTKTAQENFDDINVTFSEMWTDNSNSASDWTEDSINVGSYNGKYYDTSGKYAGTGNNTKLQTAFDNDATKVSAGDELGKARVQSSKSFTSGSNNISSPGEGQVRMARPSALRLYIDNIKQNPINPNGEYFPEQSYVYYKPILSYTGSEATGVANIHEDDIETNDIGDIGYTIMSRYRITDSRDGNVNSIVVQNPVSVQDARIVSLPQEMDQRTTIPTGSANDLLDKLADSEVCPLSPGLCEFRVLNCKFFEEIVKASFDFEQISTVAMVEDENEDESASTSEISENQLTFYNFEDNNYGITSTNSTIEYSQNRMVVTVKGKNATIEIPVDISADSISQANIYFGTSAKSTTAKMSWVGANNSIVSTTITPETINQTMTFNLNASNQWKNAGKVSKVILQLDGDNLGTGVYIISKIEFLEHGVGASSGTIQGSEDDRTIIRSLIKSSAGKVLDYDLTSGFNITENDGTFSGFGTGRYFKAAGTRIAMNLDELGLGYDEHTTIKLEANVYIPSNAKDNMLFSLGGVGFYIPAGQTYAAFTTGNGVERRVNYNFIGQKMKLGVVFSFGDIKDCDIYINGTKLTDISTVNSSIDISEEIVGENVNIGSWTKNSNFVTAFFMDNFSVVKMPGTSTHTASCYTTIQEHSYEVNYLDELTHVFNYTGGVQTYTAPETGYFKLEAWGASGGGSSNQTIGSHAGLGGYTSGEIYLTKGQTIQIIVGGQGKLATALGTGGGYNGGGNGGPSGYGGGGATDFRLSGSSLNNRVMVAGGGGGSDNAGDVSGGIDDGSGGAGGIIGGNAFKEGVEISSQEVTAAPAIVSNGGGCGLGGTQSSGYSFGTGESVTYATDTGGAGGGYWGGYVTNHNNGGAGGGSSYVGGVNSGDSLTGVNYGNGKAKITQLSHVHSTATCPYEVTHMNSHVHDATCITDESSELMNALMLADQGYFTLLKSLIGDDVYNRLKAPSNILYTWNNWSLTDYKQFYPINGTILGINGSNLRISFTANDPFFGVKTNLNAGSIQKIRIYTNISGQTDKSAQLFFDTGSGYNETSSVWASKTGTSGWQWIEFDMASNPTWSGTIKSLRVDLVPYSGGYADINQIQLVGSGSATAGTATSVLYTYTGFSDTKKFGISDSSSPATTTFVNGAVVNSGDLTGLDFVLPLNITNADALQFIRITMATNTGNYGGVYKNSGNEQFSGASSYVSNGDGTYTVIYDTSTWTGSITSIGFDTAAGTVSGTTRVSKIELIGYGNLTTTPTESFTSGVYDAHIHTQDCIYTPQVTNYSPVTLTTQHHTSNGGYTAATGWSSHTSNPGDPQRMYNGSNTVGLTSSIGPNRYVRVRISETCLSYMAYYYDFSLKINDTWMTVNQAVTNGYIINPTVEDTNPGYYTPHPSKSNLLSGGNIGTGTWNGVFLYMYTSSTCTIQDIKVSAYYYDYGGMWNGMSKPGDGIWVNSGALTLSGTGTWSCNNLPLNTYADLVTPVTPVARTVGGSTGSQAFNYTGGMQTFVAPHSGTYTFEVYGAEGGYSSQSSSYGGKGGYSKGSITLTAGQTAYVYVGGKGSDSALPYDTTSTAYGGFNGGGTAYNSGYGGGAGGGATDIRIGGTNLGNRVIVAGGGGGAGYTYSGLTTGGSGGGIIGGAGIGTSYGAGQGGTQTAGGAADSSGSGKYFAGTLGQGAVSYGWSWGGAAGGGGYYGGGSGFHSAGGGSGYVGGVTNSSMSSGIRSGNGYAVISWAGTTVYTGPDYVAPSNRQSYNFTPATITYTVATPVKSTLTSSFGSLDGTVEGIQATISLIANEYRNIPETVNGEANPVFSCANKPNVHKCTDECQEVTVLTCNEPHHYGQHYDYDNDICWDACGNDNNHKHSVTESVTDTTGQEVKYGTFINLDNYFQVYFPNVGDFMGTNEYGIEDTTMNRGKGYTNGMNTLEWTREKKVAFGYDVLFNRNGVWEQHTAGEWITLPLRDSSGNELTYYDFYCLLSNKEEIGAGVEFAVEAINLNPSPGGKGNPYEGDDNFNVDTFIDSGNNYVTNRERFGNLYAFHSAYRTSYVDVVGRIGNLIMEDTEDLRFSNLFKESTVEDKWIIEGLIHEVDTSISNSYLSWFNNDGSLAKDIRGLQVSKDSQMYNTYGTQAWTNVATALSLPLDASKNVIPSLKTEQLKPGYNVLFDISTIGDYRSKVQVVPYFYSLNTDTNTLTPVDVYIRMDGGYEPINYFGLMSEYVLPNNTYSDEFYKLKDTLYEYIMNLDWTEESKRRNYSAEEETITKYMSMNATEYVRDAFGNVLTSKYLDIPYGSNYALGTLQMLLPSTRARTFIGSSKVTAVNINGGTETNINGSEQGASFINNAQRWHLKLGLPSSVAFVPYRNGIHVDPTDDVTLSDGTVCKAFEELEKGNTVILMTADIKAIGDTYILGYDQGNNNGRVVINGKTYNFGSDIPTLIAVYDGTKNSTVDVDFIGTH